MRKVIFVLAATAVLGLASAASAQLEYSVSNEKLVQDFDTLGNSGANPLTWTNNSTLLGWYAYNSQAGGNQAGRDPGPVTGWPAVGRYQFSTGTGNSGDIYSFGAAAATDRALGSVASGNTTFGGDFVFALVLLNTTGETLTDFSLSYTGEQWRNGGNTSAHTLDFDYAIFSSFTPATQLPGNVVAGYTDPGLGELDFTGPTVGAAAAALDGNAAANQAFVSGSEGGLSWGDGEYLVLRWFDDNNAGNDHGLGIDSLSFTATPEPATMALLGLGGLFMARRRR